MSTTSKVRRPRNSPSVIVRSFGDVPVKLLAIRRCGRSIEVIGPDAKKPIYLRIRDVYTFDESTFDRLKTAADKGDNAGLNSLWAAAPPFRPAELSPKS